MKNKSRHTNFILFYVFKYHPLFPLKDFKLFIQKYSEALLPV